jgi:hypothetical protein
LGSGSRSGVGFCISAERCEDHTDVVGLVEVRWLPSLCRLEGVCSSAKRGLWYLLGSGTDTSRIMSPEMELSPEGQCWPVELGSD